MQLVQILGSLRYMYYPVTLNFTIAYSFKWFTNYVKKMIHKCIILGADDNEQQKTFPFTCLFVVFLNIMFRCSKTSNSQANFGSQWLNPNM